MARTDDDSWDITESVGATALGVAWARSQESTSQCPLFTDPYAQMFIDEAIARGWKLPPTPVVERIRSISGYAASRTKWFDEFFIAAGAAGIDQAVILAAGLDATGVAAAMERRQRGLRDRPAEGACVQGRDLARTPC